MSNSLRAGYEAESIRNPGAPMTDRTPEEISKDLTKHEIAVLSTICGGPDRIGGWGARVSATMGSLRGKGLAALSGETFEPTPLGQSVASVLLTPTETEHRIAQLETQIAEANKRIAVLEAALRVIEKLSASELTHG